MSGGILDVATRMHVWRWQSANLVLVLDLTKFIREKKCLHTYVLPNWAIRLRAKAASLGYLSTGKYN